MTDRNYNFRPEPPWIASEGAWLGLTIAVVSFLLGLLMAHLYKRDRKEKEEEDKKTAAEKRSKLKKSIVLIIK